MLALRRAWPAAWLRKQQTFLPGVGISETAKKVIVMFKKMDKTATVLPPRQWALVGYPGSGKSTFATQMVGPLLVVDSDHRFQEVAPMAVSDVYEVSENPEDHADPEAVASLLKSNIKGSGVKTIVIDSLTSILTPRVIAAIMDNDAGRNKNRVSAFKDKALAMRLLQDSITGTGCNTLWIYHLRTGMDGNAKERETTTISPVELARLRRSLNLELRVVQEGAKRGIRVDWARRGRSGMTLWDDSGTWLDMPAKIETAVYGGLTALDMADIEHATPAAFASVAAAIAWGFEQGCFRDAVHAQNAYEEVKREKNPQNAPAMWRLWISEVEERMAAAGDEAREKADMVPA